MGSGSLLGRFLRVFLPTLTILRIVTKVLETVLRKKIGPLIETNQNCLQRGFTRNSSPLNGSLILEEVIREHKDKRLPIYITFLDAKQRSTSSLIIV